MAQLATRQAELVVELSDVRAAIAAGQSDPPIVKRTNTKKK